MLNKKKIYASISLGVLLFTMAACSSNSKQVQTKPDAKTEVKKKETYKFEYVSNSTFLVTKDGKLIKQKDLPKDAVMVDWYFDPYCPTCVKLEGFVAKEGTKFYNEEGVYYRYHPLSFLDKATQNKVVDGKKVKDGYSVEASSFILSVAEVKPEIAVNYMNKVLSVDFYPVEGQKSIDSFKSLFVSLKGTEDEWKKVVKLQKELKLENKKSTQKALDDVNLAKRSHDGSLYVPFILIGKEKQALNFESLDSSVDYIKKEVSDYKKSLEPVKKTDDTKKTDEVKKTGDTKKADEAKNSVETKENKK